MQQARLYEEEDETVEPKFSIGEAVRNASYHMHSENDLSNKRRIVYEVILVHPEGITNKEIAWELGWPINCVTGRVAELRDRFHLIEKNGIKTLPSHEGKMYPNTTWRATS